MFWSLASSVLMSLRVTLVKVEEPGRQAGVMVESAEDLVGKLKNEAKVI